MRIRVPPLPGGISNKTVPFERLKRLVFGRKRNIARSPTRAREPSLKRKSAKEALPVDKLSPGVMRSLMRALRQGCFLNLSRTNFRSLRISAFVSGTFACATSETGNSVNPHTLMNTIENNLRNILGNLKSLTDIQTS